MYRQVKSHGRLIFVSKAKIVDSVATSQSGTHALFPDLVRESLIWAGLDLVTSEVEITCDKLWVIWKWIYDSYEGVYIKPYL